MWLPVAALVLLFVSSEVRAQFSGTIGIGGQATNNVQSLDTTAPDNILLPAFELNYDWHLNGASKLGFTGSYSPNLYSVNTPFSFNLTTIGATGTFYLTNLDAIEAEYKEGGSESQPSYKSTHFNALPNSGGSDMFSGFASIGTAPAREVMPTFFSPPSRPEARAASNDVNDSLVEIAVGALYTLSGQLDSTDILTKGISKARVQEFEDLRDSISDVLSTAADLLDSTGYSESAAQIIIPELEHARGPLARLMPQTKPSHTDPTLLDAAINALKSAKPESDFLPTEPPPSPSSSTPQATKKVIESLQKLPPIASQQPEKVEASAPILTLIQSSTRLRDFASSDAFVREDLDDSNATTMATALTIPLSWSSHTSTNFSPSDSNLFGGISSGNPNDYHSVAFGAAFEGLPSTSFSIRGGWDYTRSTYPFDSVYSNSENRFGITPCLAMGPTTVLFGDASIGLRDYLNPLQVTTTQAIPYDSIGAKGHIFHKFKDSLVTKAAASKFTQFSFGAGLAQFIGERWVIGGLVAFNRNPNLRAYVTTAQVQNAGKKGVTVRAAVQIADDEFTYDLSRFTAFSTARVFWDLDLGGDVSCEQRTYGSAVGPKGNTVPGGEGRTETGWFFNASLSKLIPIENPILGFFSSLMVEAKLEVASVNASQSLYSYQASTGSLTATLGF